MSLQVFAFELYLSISKTRNTSCVLVQSIEHWIHPYW